MKAIDITTVVETTRHIHFIFGVKADSAGEINFSIPSRVVSIKKPPAGHIIMEITIIENPKKELINISPAGAAINDNSVPKSISLVGRTFPAEEILQISKVPTLRIKPKYIKSR